MCFTDRILAGSYRGDVQDLPCLGLRRRTARLWQKRSVANAQTTCQAWHLSLQSQKKRATNGHVASQDVSKLVFMLCPFPKMSLVRHIQLTPDIARRLRNQKPPRLPTAHGCLEALDPTTAEGGHGDVHLAQKENTMPMCSPQGGWCLRHCGDV